MRSSNYLTFRRLLVPMVVVALMFVVLALGGSFLLDRINSIRNDLNLAREEEGVLSEKFQILEEFEIEGKRISENLVLAFPEGNSAIYVISGLRLDAASFGILPENIQVGRGNLKEGGLYAVEITFDLRGNFSDIFNLISSLKGTAPYGKVENVKLDQISGVADSTVIYRIYYSEFPKKINSVNSPLPKFSDDDIKIIQDLSSLSKSDLVEIQPQGETSRDNPFGI